MNRNFDGKARVFDRQPRQSNADVAKETGSPKSATINRTFGEGVRLEIVQLQFIVTTMVESQDLDPPTSYGNATAWCRRLAQDGVRNFKTSRGVNTCLEGG